MWQAVTNFMTNTHGVLRGVLSQLNKSSKCFIRLNSDSRDNMIFFFTFRTNGDRTEEIGLVVVSRLKILSLNLIVVQYSISLFFFQGGTVTSPSIWLVLSAVRIFLPLPMGTVTLSWVAKYIPSFVANFFINICCFTARQHFQAQTSVTISSPILINDNLLPLSQINLVAWIAII